MVNFNFIILFLLYILFEFQYFVFYGANKYINYFKLTFTNLKIVILITNHNYFIYFTTDVKSL